MGVAQALMTEGEKKSKAKEIVLEVDETNQPAIILYYRNGYVEFGRYDKYYGKTDAIRMKKIIK
jgi:ribosomal protein S18 acetylase RimI-like enzyme